MGSFFLLEAEEKCQLGPCFTPDIINAKMTSKIPYVLPAPISVEAFPFTEATSTAVEVSDPFASFDLNELKQMPFHALTRTERLPTIVTDVYDGDTVYGVIHDPVLGLTDKYRIRMNGYDSPEMKPSRSLPDRDAEIARAKEAKREMERLVLSTEETGKRIVELQFDGWDKYGRVLATIFVPELEESVNSYMITHGYGYEYHGGTKQKKKEAVA